MKKKIFALFVVCAFVLNGISTAFADIKSKKNVRQAPPLVALLPASEGASILNVQKFFNEALPQTLSDNQPMLSSILDKIDEIKNKTGIDLRQFEQIAVGVQSKRLSPVQIDFEPIVLARGTFNAGALIAVAKVASKGKYREEKIGGKTVYVFTLKELVEKDKSSTNKPTGKNSIFEKTIDKMFSGLSRELAVTVYNNNILAIGSLARVRELFDAKTRISSEVLDLVSRKPNAVISFGANLPGGLSKFVDLDNDELGKNIDAIRQLSGAVDVSDGNAVVSLMAKTLKPDQAQGLQETLEGLQLVGKALLGGSKGANNKVFGRMVENVRISRNGNEVMLDLQIPNSDINILIGEKK
ncbi:MAG: hypothetical protein M3Q33_03140 [Acidobacteriota bacterium]|nr:hypothetical protein [Acidobacteriota bacterium]